MTPEYEERLRCEENRADFWYSQFEAHAMKRERGL